MKNLLTICLVLLPSLLFGKTIFTEDFESPVVSGYDQQPPIPSGWVAATHGYKATYHGLCNIDSGQWTNNTPLVNKQSYSFRYSSNTGITTANGAIGKIDTFYAKYTVSFDCFDSIAGGVTNEGYSVVLIAYGDSETVLRNNVLFPKSIYSDSVFLYEARINVVTNGEPVTITYVTDPILDANLEGKDFTIQFRNRNYDSDIDNVTVTYEPFIVNPNKIVAVGGKILAINNKAIVNPTPWTPSKIETIAWYDADTTASIVKSGGLVSKWKDKSGNGRDIAQTSASAQPAYSSEAVSFDGTSDYLWNSSPFMYNNGAIDIFIVGSIAPANDARIIAEASSLSTKPMYDVQTKKETSSSIMGAYVRRDNNSVVFSNLNNLSASGAFDNTQKIYQWRDTGSSMIGRVNTTNAVTVTYTRAGTLTLNRFAVGSLLRAVPAAYVDAEINEIVICNNLSLSDRQKMEGYLAWKWGMESELPSDHPYKNRRP